MIDDGLGSTIGGRICPTCLGLSTRRGIRGRGLTSIKGKKGAMSCRGHEPSFDLSVASRAERGPVCARGRGVALAGDVSYF